MSRAFLSGTTGSLKIPTWTGAPNGGDQFAVYLRLQRLSAWTTAAANAPRLVTRREGAGAGSWVLQGDQSVANALLFQSQFSGTGNFGSWRFPTPLALGAWYDVLLIYDYTTWTSVPRMFLNGLEVTPTAVATPVSGTPNVHLNDVLVGNRSAGAGPACAAIAELAWWRGRLLDTREALLIGAYGPDAVRRARTGWWQLDRFGPTYTPSVDGPHPLVPNAGSGITNYAPGSPRRKRRWPYAPLAYVPPGGSPQTATPASAVSTWTALAAAVVLGAVSVTPAPAVDTWTVPTPSVAVGAVTASPAPASNTWVVPAAARALGGVTASPSPAASTWTALTPSTGGATTATPASAASTWVVPTPAGALGAVTAHPTPAVGTWTALTPTASAGNAPQTATPSAAVSTWSVPSASVGLGSVSVAPAPAHATWTALAPTVTLGTATAQPSPASSTWQALAPSTNGSTVTTPNAARATWVVPTPAVIVGGVTAAPASASSAWTARTPAIAVGAVVAQPSAAGSTWTANAPTTGTHVPAYVATTVLSPRYATTTVLSPRWSAVTVIRPRYPTTTVLS